MKKKSIWQLLIIVMVAMVSMAFVSCGNDDDDLTMSNSIVGTWEWVDDEGDYYARIIFQKDGTGTWTEYECDELEIWKFSYQYDSDTQFVVIVYEDGEKEAVSVIINGNKMILDGYPYYRIK